MFNKNIEELIKKDNLANKTYLTEFDKNFSFNKNMNQLFTRANYKMNIKPDIVLKKFEQGIYPYIFIDTLKVIFKYKVLTLKQIAGLLNMENEVGVLQMLNDMHKEQLINSFTLSFESRYDNRNLVAAPDSALVYCIDNAGLVLLSRHSEVYTMNAKVTDNYMGPSVLSRHLTVNEISVKMKKYLKDKLIKRIPSPKVFLNNNIEFHPSLFMRVKSENSYKDFLFQKVSRDDMEEYFKDLFMFLKLLNETKAYETIWKDVFSMPELIFVCEDVETIKEIEKIIRDKDFMPISYTILSEFVKDGKEGTCYVKTFDQEKGKTILKQTRIKEFVL